MRWTRYLIATAVVGAMLTPSPATAVSLNHPLCADTTASLTPIVAGGAAVGDWKENLAVGADGTLWVSSPARNRVYHLTTSGQPISTINVPGPGGMAFGPDGRLYVGQNKGVFAFAAPGGASVVRIDPASAHPTAQPFATGLDTINGLAVGADGSVYLTSETGAMRRIAPDGQPDAAWSKDAGLAGSNGLVFRDGDLFTTMTLSATSEVITLDADEPGDKRMIAELSGLTTTLIPKGLDDLTFGPDDTLYAAAFVTGEILRVDIESGESCAVVKGLFLPTSIRPSHDDPSTYYVTEASGRVLRLTAQRNA